MKTMDKNKWKHRDKKNKGLMRLNRFFSKTRNIVIYILLIYIFIYLIINYSINLIEHIDEIFQNLSNQKSWLIHAKFIFYPRLSEYYSVYIIGIVIATILSMVSFYKFKINYADLNVNQRGGSRWTTLNELKSQYHMIPEKKQEYKGHGGFLVSRYEDFLLIDDSPVNNLIIGTTRSGKGETVIFPMIDLYSRASEKSSLIIMDPKLELYTASKATLEYRGYKVLLLNLVDCMKGVQYNPLQIIVEAYKSGNFSEAELLCNTFATSIFPDKKTSGQEQFWNKNAINLLSALILALTEDCIKEGHEEKINLYSLVNMFQEMILIKVSEEQYVLDIYFQNRPERDRAKMKYATIASSPARTKGGIFATMTQSLTLFTYEEIAKMTSGNTFNLKDVGFGNMPIALFLGIPDYDTSRYFLATTFISQLYYVLAKKASKSVGGQCSREVVFLLDEFGNMPAIDNFANIITVCLGRNIRFNIVIQSIAQLTEKYDKQTSEIIMSNCGNIMYLLTSDYQTAQTISNMIGNETTLNVNRSGKKMSLEKTFTEDYIPKPLMDPNRLMSEMMEGCNIVCRSLKRKDKKGRDIQAYPIYNQDETRFKYRHQYLLDDFPSDNTIDEIAPFRLYDVDLSHIVYYPPIFRDVQKSMLKTWKVIYIKLREYWPMDKIDQLTIGQICDEVEKDPFIDNDTKFKLKDYLTRNIAGR